jgi:hypothetical protein
LGGPAPHVDSRALGQTVNIYCAVQFSFSMYYRLYYAAAAVLCMRWGASNHSIVVIYRPGIAWPFFYLRSTDFAEKERKRRLDIYFLLLSFFLCLQDDADSRVARI